MITIFTYQAVQWENGKLVETPLRAIGFTNLPWIVGTKLGEFRLDEQSGEWSFFQTAILPEAPLSVANLQTIVDKLNQLNFDALPTKKSPGLFHEKAHKVRKKASKAKGGD